jgi:hypothetical protein
VLRSLRPLQPLCKVGKHGINLSLGTILAEAILSAEKFDKPLPVPIASINVNQRKLAPPRNNFTQK